MLRLLCFGSLALTGCPTPAREPEARVALPTTTVAPAPPVDIVGDAPSDPATPAPTSPRAEDLCPAGTTWSERPERACLELAPDRSKGWVGRIWTPKFEFEFDKGTLRASSFETLDGVVMLILRYPEIAKVSIEAHLGVEPETARSRILSNDRARSVAKYLISHGVEPRRLESKGFEGSVPLADPKTEEGRAVNRRVDFRIIP